MGVIRPPSVATAIETSMFGYNSTVSFAHLALHSGILYYNYNDDNNDQQSMALKLFLLEEIGLQL